MEVIRDLDEFQRNAVKEACKSYEKYPTHIELVLTKNLHCYLTNISAIDYDKLLIYSALPNAQDPTRQPISEAIVYIKSHPEFLAQSNYDGVLSGGKVQKYLNQLSAHQPRLQDYFQQLGYCFVDDRSTATGSVFAVTDGMHRLVAYGLASDLAERHFPIQIYFATNRNFQVTKPD